MPTCPRCHQSVDAQAIACPYCRTALKAFGHPGIPLYQAGQGEFLCETCTYHADDTCNYPQRPYAKECTLYQNRLQPQSPVRYKPGSSTLSGWLQRNSTWLMWAGLIVISFVIALRIV